MERTHQVSRHHTRLIISAQMPMFLLRRVRSRLALLRRPRVFSYTAAFKG